MEKTFIEMFCGIGGFRLGLERSGWKCLWANDVDKYACKIYRKNFGGGELVDGDIRKIDPDDIPDHTILTAGFPCQSFSVAGRRKGFEDTRGTLFFDIARVIEAKRPPLLLLENVKGLLSAQRGYCFARILQTLDELGYNVLWRVLNSKHFGVPQNRERVFIIGCLGEERFRKILSVGLEGEENHRPSRKKGSVMIYDGHHQRFTDELGTLTGRENRRGTYWAVVVNDNGILRERDTVTCIDSNYWKGMDSHMTRSMIAHGCVFDDVLAIKGDLISYKNPHRQKGISREMFALRGAVQHGIADISRLKIRRLTPVECERLQGFPDGWTEGISDTQRYRLLGNAVTVNVIEYLGKMVMHLINERDGKNENRRKGNQSA